LSINASLYIAINDIATVMTVMYKVKLMVMVNYYS